MAGKKDAAQVGNDSGDCAPVTPPALPPQEGTFASGGMGIASNDCGDCAPPKNCDDQNVAAVDAGMTRQYLPDKVVIDGNDIGDALRALDSFPCVGITIAISQTDSVSGDIVGDFTGGPGTTIPVGATIILLDASGDFTGESIITSVTFSTETTLTWSPPIVPFSTDAKITP